MFVYMQAYVEIMLVAILVVILFNGPIAELGDFANSVLGKAVMVCLVIFVSHQFGTNAGLLMATITVVLLNRNIEGFDSKEGMARVDCDENSADCDTSGVASIQSKEFGATAAKAGKKRKTDAAPGASHTAYGRQGGAVNGTNRAKQFTRAAAGASGTTGNGVATAAGPVVVDRPVAEVKDKPKVEEERPVPVEEKKKEEERPLEESPKKKEKFSNYTLDNASDYTNLGSTLAAYSTNDNIMSSMRASEYAKTAPGGCALMTNHMDTMRVVNNPRSEGIF